MKAKRIGPTRVPDRLARKMLYLKENAFNPS
jgi:hypothetical protein